MVPNFAFTINQFKNLFISLKILNKKATNSTILTNQISFQFQ